MIKNAPKSIKIRLYNLYNNILASGVFPHDWKIAVLSPIPKTGKNPSQLDGYRPISLLPVLSKIFEKILAKRFWRIARMNISKNQHAFIPRHGVHSLCHQLEDTLRQNTKNRKHSLVISEDIEKAFDRVISTYIIVQLNEWGFPRGILRLLKSFLDNRRVLVKINGFFSSTHTLDNGVPQGSPLSVVLYIIYANSLAKVVENLPGIDFVGIYADNIFAVSSGRPEVVQSNLQNLHIKISQWAKSRGAVIPPEKTEVLHVCRKTSCNSNTLHIGDNDFLLLEQMRVLGIQFTRNLLWNNHVKFLATKLTKINNLLKLICSRNKGPHIETALNICQAITTGAILHGITIYGWTSKKNIAKINTLLNSCYRTATGLLRPTPIDLLRTEAKYIDFQRLLEKTAAGLASRSITITAEGLHETFWKYLKNPFKETPSAMKYIMFLLRKNNMPIPQKPIPNNAARAVVRVDDSLSVHKKDGVNPKCFKKLLAEKIALMAPTTILYTDGSFQSGITSFAVVRQISNTQFETIKKERLPDHIGIFIAEIAAIKCAIRVAAETRGNALICTDSLSAIKALIKNRSGAYDDILYTESSHSISLLWIPSHIGIRGNEIADFEAKEAQSLPGITEVPGFPKTLMNPFKFIQNGENFTTPRIKYNINFSRAECIMMARLRVGKAVFNTKYYYDRTDPPRCMWCNVILSVPHILTECPVSRMDEPLEKTLDCSMNGNISKIRNSLLKHNIRDV